MKLIRYETVLMNFQAGLHLGGSRPDDYSRSEIQLHSDTLKSALFACDVELQGKADMGFWDSFLLSSAFPYCGEIRFLPKPMLQLQEFDKDELEDNMLGKTFKKIHYLDSEIWLDAVTNRTLKIRKKWLSTDGSFCSKHDYFFSTEYRTGENEKGERREKKIVVSEVQSRVSVPRFGSRDPEPFELDRLFFAKDSGLYCMMEITDEKYRNRIHNAWQLLSENGIGTDRTYGNGHFLLSFGNMSFKAVEKPNGRINLSLFCPTKFEIEQIDLSASSYRVIKRGGRIASPSNESNRYLFKRSVYMMDNASVFKTTHNLLGTTHDLRPNETQVEHPIYREGKALFFPCKINEQ